MKKFIGLLKDSYKEWSEDKASRLAAALSYYTIFSLAPLLVIVIAIAGLIFGQDAARGAIVDQISGLVGQQGAEQIQTMIQNVNHPATGIIATIFGVVVLLLGATGVFGQLQDAMNTIWEVKPKEGRGIIGMIKDRFLSFTMVLGVGFLLLVSLVVSAGLTALGNVLTGFLPDLVIIMRILSFVISFAVITGLFVLLFKFLPDAKIAWSDVWLGAAVTALLFTIGRLVIGIYLGNSSVATPFGAAGSLIVLLVWVYYSGQILFFGAEFTQVYANTYGSRIVPAENAERVTEADREQQGIPHAEQGSGAHGLAAQPAVAPRQAPHQPLTAVPSTASMQPALSAVPVTGPQPARVDEPVDRLAGAAIPAVIAIGIGILGSVAIALEQRKRPLVRHKRKIK